MPDDCGKIIEADCLAMVLEARVQWDDGMPPVILPPRQAHVTDVDNQSASGNECPVAVFPDLIEGVDEFVVVSDVSKLLGVIVVTLQCPIRRGREHKVNRVVRQSRCGPGIS